MKQTLLFFLSAIVPVFVWAQKPVPLKPRILISTDIGGTDPDDNQSMAHFLMYSNRFETEGLVSSPSFGSGRKAEILRMIDLYEKDLPKLKAHESGFPTSDYLRSITKQGVHGGAPLAGYTKSTEGSDWIVKCAMKPSKQPLWVLVWGGLEDVAQALHDEPRIKKKIKVYYIGGPNKKWGANSYAFIAKNFPDLWMIESNGTFDGFFIDDESPEDLKKRSYYAHHIKDAGSLGKDFKNYYKSFPKMGDTPSLLYMMDGDPNDPTRENWGGSYERIKYSPRRVYERNLTITDTVPVYSILEIKLKGPVVNIPHDSTCIKMTVRARIGVQTWPGFYVGNGEYVIRYSPKQTETLNYEIISEVPGFQSAKGQFVVDNTWPGVKNKLNYKLGKNWFSDRQDPKLFFNGQQGARTISKWRDEVFKDWAKRWAWLAE